LLTKTHNQYLNQTAALSRRLVTVGGAVWLGWR
jgi:hypothetical protein